MPVMRETGTVRSFDRATGYGFVISDRGNPDVWLHVRNVIGASVPYRGARVEFIVKRLPDRRSEALNVRILTL